MAATCSLVSPCLLKHRSKSPGRRRDVARKFWASVIPDGEITENCRGVFIYYKTELSVVECKDFTDCGFQESCWCIVTLETNEKLLLGAIYHSPSSSPINTNRPLVRTILMRGF